MLYSKNSNELVTTHGFSAGQAQNQVIIWRYPSMQQVAQLTGHTYRVRPSSPSLQLGVVHDLELTCAPPPAGPLPRRLARRADDRHGRRRRDAAVLERVPQEQGRAQDRHEHAQPVRPDSLSASSCARARGREGWRRRSRLAGPVSFSLPCALSTTLRPVRALPSPPPLPPPSLVSPSLAGALLPLAPLPLVLCTVPRSACCQNLEAFFTCTMRRAEGGELVLLRFNARAASDSEDQESESKPSRTAAVHERSMLSTICSSYQSAVGESARARERKRPARSDVLLDAQTSRRSSNPASGDCSLDCAARPRCYGWRSCRGPCEARSTWCDSAPPSSRRLATSVESSVGQERARLRARTQASPCPQACAGASAGNTKHH